MSRRVGRAAARRCAIPVSGLAALVAAALALAGSEAHPATLERAAARPNVLVIETDDQTVEQMKVMDHVNALIGANGVTFANNFVNYSLCCPSRTTFMTGQYAHNHRVWSNVAPYGGFQRFLSLHAYNNLPVWLHHAGYHTGLIGKYLNQYRSDGPVMPGWSEWHAAPEGYGAYNYPINNGGTLTQYGEQPADFKDDVLTRKAVDFIDRRAPRAQPFFLWLTYTAPHWSPPDPNPNPPYDCRHAAKPAPRYAHAFDSRPLPRPPNFNEADVADKPARIRYLSYMRTADIADVQRKYRCELESLLSVDEGVQRLVRALKAATELRNTLIIYTSDNGHFHGEHRIQDDKQKIYEESIRVPLEMRGPGIPVGVKIYPQVINADLAPTIVDATNVQADLVMDGASLLPVIAHPGVHKDRELLVEEPTFKAIRTKHYMYAEHDTGERELYDLRNDPFELRSRHSDPTYAAIKAQLATRLDELRTCDGASCRVYRPDPPGP